MHGDALEKLKTMPDKSVDCCVTSPPYYGLRDYGTGKWVGGDPDCKHRGKPFAIRAHINRNCTGGNDIKNQQVYEPYKKVCPLCGAVRVDRQIGLEETPEEYISRLVAVFREVRRVLRDDGTLWVNIGDSYSNVTSGDLKQKDIIGIPWMLAFALRADGWYLRQDIIWHKPNPMPESVKDRCTKAHEYIFLLSKSQRYYFDHDSIKEPAKPDNYVRDRDGTKMNNTPGRTKMKGLKTSHYTTKNKRDVWSVTSQPVKEAHFATFPEKLIEPCILAGSRPGGTVLDPFFGSGTTGRVAKRLNRDFIGIELNEEYIEISKRRIDSVQMDLCAFI